MNDSTIHTPPSDEMYTRQRLMMRRQNRLYYIELEGEAVARMKTAMHEGDPVEAVELALAYAEELAYLDARYAAYVEPIPEFLTDAFDAAFADVAAVTSDTAARWVPEVPPGVIAE